MATTILRDLTVDPAVYESSSPALVNSDSPPSPLPAIQDRRRRQSLRDEAYAVPEQEAEIERRDLLDMQWKVILDGQLHLSPHNTTGRHNVMDLGTGTGSWARDYATAHPEAVVVATDLVPPTTKRPPPNCYFVQCNAEAPWPFVEKFDFIHARTLFTGIRDWPQLLRRMYINLKPGGWVEIGEPQFPLSYIEDGMVKTNSPLFVWSHLCHLGAKQLGLDSLISLQLEQMLEEAGFVNIRTEWIKLPVGTWALGKTEKQLGWCCAKNLERNLRPLAHKCWIQGLGWRPKQVDGFLTEVRKDIKSGKGHYFWQFGIFSAQKPELSSPITTTSSTDSE